jgi:hypothetical protein
MKSQIALLGIGVVIAAGVAYVELKPAANEPVATVTSTPTADSVVSQAPAAVPTTNTSTKIATPVIPKPTFSITGGDDEDEDEEDDDRDEEDDDRDEDDD